MWSEILIFKLIILRLQYDWFQFWTLKYEGVYKRFFYIRMKNMSDDSQISSRKYWKSVRFLLWFRCHVLSVSSPSQVRQKFFISSKCHIFYRVRAKLYEQYILTYVFKISLLYESENLNDQKLETGFNLRTFLTPCCLWIVKFEP